MDKYDQGHFGACPRVFCHATHVLPCGRADIPGLDTIKLYCPNCGDIYSPPSSKYASVDGESFPPLPIISTHQTSSYLTPPSNIVCRIFTSPCTHLTPPNPTTNVQAPFSVQPLRPYSSRHTPNFYPSHSTQPVKRTLNAHPLLDLSLHHHLQRL